MLWPPTGEVRVGAWRPQDGWLLGSGLMALLAKQRYIMPKVTKIHELISL